MREIVKICTGDTSTCKNNVRSGLKYFFCSNFFLVFMIFLLALLNGAKRIAMANSDDLTLLHFPTAISAKLTQLLHVQDY